jgi:4-diphosphocytidyl-2-C-methyl-D-erythritol kinase
MKNVLELVTMSRYDIIGKAKKRMEGSGAAGSMMSGSGPTVFGLFMDLPLPGPHTGSYQPSMAGSAL